MAKPVVGGAFLRVRQGLIGLVQILELGFRRLVAGVAVGMAAHRRLAEGGFHVGLGRAFGDTESLIVIALGHKVVFAVHDVYCCWRLLRKSRLAM